jgi:hypothetical protein
LLVVGVVRGAKFLWSGLRERDSTTSVQLATALHVIYWVASAVAVSVAFSFNVRVESTHLSYYATILFSVAAVVPLLMSGRSPARWIVPVGASIFFAASLVGLTRHLFDGAIPAIARYESNIVKFAKANHATTGFAGYWEASSLTWSSHDRVLARPVGGCANPEGADICPFPLERVPSWYVPRQRRTFLLVDPHEIYLPSLPKGLGQPLAVGAFGRARMYVYPYDIASRIAPPSD